MKFIEVTIKGKTFPARVEEIDGQVWVHLKGRVFVLPPADKPESVAKGGAPPVSYSPQVTEAGRRAEAPSPPPPPTARARLSPAGQEWVLSPMPGQIVKVPVKEGMKVKENQTLLALSSMKMEYVVKSPRAGVVLSVKTKEGDMVQAGQELIELKTVV